MAQTYQIQLVTTSLEDGSTIRTSSETEIGNVGEEFWARAKVAAGASEVELKLNLLTDPVALVVYGDEGIWYKKTTGPTTDKFYAQPIAVETAEDGLGLSAIYLGNDDTAEHTVTVIAYE